MSTTTHTTRITQAYLMGKTKRELADEYLILCDAKDKIQDEHERLVERVAFALERIAVALFWLDKPTPISAGQGPKDFAYNNLLHAKHRLEMREEVEDD